MASGLSNNFKDLLAQKQIDFSADTFKGILMQAGFAFDKATHDEYADVSASELATAYGYTVGGVILTGVTITRNDTTNKVEITWNNASWTASGGDIEAQGLLILDDTVTNDPVIGFIDYGAARKTFDGGNHVVANIQVDW